MDLSAAAALCLWLLSACRPRDGLEAAAVLRAAGAGPAWSPGGGGGGRTLVPAPGPSALRTAAVPGPRAVRRAAGSGFRNGSVVPHHFMMSLYRSLAGRAPATAASGHGRADTITGFIDQATQEESVAQPGQSFLFDVSGLPEADELVSAELRVLRKRSPEPDRDSATLPPLLLLSTCPDATRTPHLLHSRAAEPLEVARWEAFDVTDAVQSHRREPRASGKFCLVLRAVAGSGSSPLSLRRLGFFGWPGGGDGPAAEEERALLVISSRTQRKESLFREIRAQARALRAAAEPPPDPGPGAGSRKAIPGGRRRRRTALAGTRGAQGSGGGGGKGHGRRGRSRCSRKPLHVDFKELGWDDWIIAPLDYEAYHCEGVCDFPLRSHLEPTNHAIIQTLLNSMAPDAAPASCCVPARLSPISILYIDAANNVVYKQYEDMVVEACGCR
ncbi:growth/differentiation factor 7 [Onychomys torridus]|uniref:growth/differentiation factor 7 n=1 Tax=Onychomys torridus TaxID=38674 RepID=UPI00167FC167|nr:growth/differentiation factor 7 [Onychomys torridus]